jgi:hypothetical protein
MTPAGPIVIKHFLSVNYGFLKKARVFALVSFSGPVLQAL